MTLENIGVISAILIGVCALAISIWQGYETRKNFRLSATPNIGINGSWIPSSELVGIFLENHGIGPAIITKIDFQINGQKIDIIRNLTEYDLVLNKMVNEVGITLNRHSMDFEDIIAIGEKRPLLWMTDDDKKDIIKVDRFRSYFMTIYVQIEYKSIYGQKYLTKPYHAPIRMS